VVWVAREAAHARLGQVPHRGTAEWRIPRSFIEGRDTVRFIAFAADKSCAQVRFPTVGRTHYALVLERGEGSRRDCALEGKRSPPPE
jgi:hypothetical protein